MKHSLIGSRPLSTLSQAFLYISPAVFLFILPFSGTVALRLSTLVVAAITAIVVSRNSAALPIPLKLPLSIWTLVALVSLFWALEFDYSVGEIKNEIGYILIAFLTFYILTRSSLQWRIWSIALLVGILGLSASATYYLAQGIAPYTTGKVSNIGSISTHLILISPLLFMAIEKSLFKPACLLAMSGLSILGVANGYLSMNRAFWIALPVAAIVYVGLRSFRRTDGIQALKLTVIASLAMLIFGGLLLFAVIDSRFSTGISVDAAFKVIAQDPRFEVWRFAVRHIWSHPIVGSGFGNWSSHAVLAAQNFKDPQIWHAHNMLLNYGMQLGVPGMLAVLYLLVSISREFLILYRCPDDTCSMLGAAGFALLAGVLCKSMTDLLIGRNNSLLFWALTGMILGYGRCLMANRTVKPNQ